MEEEDRGEPSIEGITVPRVSWERAVKAMELLRRLVEKGCPVSTTDRGYRDCFWCLADAEGDKIRHAPDCPYDAAKEFVEGLQ